MQRHDDFSNFKSAIEWPEMRRKEELPSTFTSAIEWPEMRPEREEATGELKSMRSSANIRRRDLGLRDRYRAALRVAN